jgi:cytochrome c oxidase assembly protein subunit 15
MIVALAVVTAPSWTASTPVDPRDAGTPFRPLVVAAGAVYLQLALGAILRHTGAGLAIPDFPLAFGRVVPPFDSFEVAAHFAHRLFGVVVLLLVGYAAARAGRDRSRGDIAVPARMAATLVLLQLFLGGAVVLSRLAVAPTTAHVVNAALILAALVIAALRSRRAPAAAEAPAGLAAARGSAA